MSWTRMAALAAAMLNCGLLNASAQEASGGQWLKDGACALFSAGAGTGDAVSWTGACVDGYAEGVGTATFTHDGQSQSFTANFQRGVIPDGHVITRWGAGWSYDGETVGGRFQGAGILTTDIADRFEGNWANGKMSGFGVLRRANGERYAGDWKDDKPDGLGELFHVDGTKLAGTFADGKLVKTAETKSAPAKTPDTSKAPFGGVAGKTLTGVDGSSIALNLIEGGMELQVVPTEGTVRKTTFTFMTDRMGTVVEDSDASSAGSSVTGFFRLTGKGVEIRYSDGRSAMLAASAEGGVQMALDGDAGPSCRAWYPAGHAFSDGEKKAALNAYASKLGLPVAAMEASEGCAAAPKPQAANVPPPGAITPPVAALPPAKTKPDRRASAKAPARMAQPSMKASYRIGDYQPPSSLKGGMEQVAVKTSEVHTIDEAISVPSTRIAMATPPLPPPSKNDAANCLKVDSDGNHWGFRNACDFAVQFAYCMADGGDSLIACGSKNAVVTSAAGSVAANGFGALMPDSSLKDKDTTHSFRWIACSGGAGEVVARLDHYEPPAGRCERTAVN